MGGERFPGWKVPRNLPRCCKDTGALALPFRQWLPGLLAFVKLSVGSDLMGSTIVAGTFPQSYGFCFALDWCYKVAFGRRCKFANICNVFFSIRAQSCPCSPQCPPSFGWLVPHFDVVLKEGGYPLNVSWHSFFLQPSLNCMGFILQGPSLLDNLNNLLEDVFDLALCKHLALWVIPGV